ncbi:acyl-CoA dehydrogenase [Gryllotalpicola protaetiae]|uniref:Acyl-CoA dehydrogenase n=1 Tax=Gryllotalpicola protaetiae TaxID=2419771 RepID=A0A387BI22_9MICO|nr:acyl-CoA dehydrogenase [Gryllotalpicola protaetiae]AYG02328.1 acyl-CoA dehydrogenase [Gryllotalpicola protaetiae]
MNGSDLEDRVRGALAGLAQVHGRVDDALRWATDAGRWAPAPGIGRTPELWDFFVEAAALDVAAARVLEPHLDALAILGQAPEPVDLGSIDADATSTWGVFAAEGGGLTLTAREEGDRWRLEGGKPWCSLARVLSHALVTATVAGGARRLFAVSLRAPGVTADEGPWAARGLTQVVSAPVHFDRVEAVPVGGPGWYLERPGFFWGGIGVSACWLGGAVGVARALLSAAQRREPDQVALTHLGAVDALLNTARTALGAAARAVDGPVAGVDWPVLMLRTRNAVADAAERVVTHLGHALGPAPLALDAEHAARVADLQLYLRQHHAERDEAALGRAILESERRPW